MTRNRHPWPLPAPTATAQHSPTSTATTVDEVSCHEPCHAGGASWPGRAGLSDRLRRAPCPGDRPDGRGLADRQPVRPPVHAFRLDQIEIYFSILQPKVLTSNNLTDLDVPTERVLASRLTTTPPRHR